MQETTQSIAQRLRALRVSKSLKQSEIDELSDLPKSSTSKIETEKREATADELIRISKALGVSLDTFCGSSEFVYREEIKIVEALRAISFEDYKRILGMIEAQVYFLAKDAEPEEKKYLQGLVTTLNQLTSSDQRPRTRFADVKRVKR
jgi:transcriptional regulator with XRE-family HTH domain